MQPPGERDDWTGLSTDTLPVAEALSWAVLPRCGGVVAFAGTVRDHTEGRPGVVHLDYEAYVDHVGPRLESIVNDVRRRWPDTGRIAIFHRVGRLGVGEVSVVVAVSAPHRAEAFAAARHAIDTVKTSVPIWKRETWDGGVDWGTGSHPAQPVDEVRSAG